MESFFHFTVYIYNLLLCVISGGVFYFFRPRLRIPRE